MAYEATMLTKGVVHAIVLLFHSYNRLLARLTSETIFLFFQFSKELVVVTPKERDIFSG